MARKQPRTDHTDIVIAGDGLAGLVMALALGRNQVACTLIGPAIPAQDDGRTTAIMQDGIDFLTGLHVWNADALNAVPLSTMRLISGDHSVTFPSTEINLPQFGFNVTNTALKKALLAAVQQAPAITYRQTSITDVTTSGAAFATVTCADNSLITARLVIGADGRNSIVRERSGIGLSHHAIDQSALVCVVETDRPHNFTSTEWYHSGGPFTLVPMQGQQMGVVYCDTTDRVADLAADPIDTLSDYFTAFSNGLYGDLRIINTPQIWPIAPQHSDMLIAPHVALIGEAAHVMPPLAAQGFNTSLRDIQALQKTIGDAFGLGLDIGHVSVLQNYATIRRLDMRLRGLGVNGLNWLIRRDDKIGHGLHDWGFKTITRIKPLKRFLMRAALAPRSEGLAA